MTRKSLIPLYRAEKEYGFQPVERPRYVAIGYCQWCGKKITNPRRYSFCSADCSDAYYKLVTWERTRSGYSNHIVWRDNCTCQDCGNFMAYQNEYGIYIPLEIGAEVHHIQPVSMGGKDNPENLITLCHECHIKRHRNLNTNGGKENE